MSEYYCRACQDVNLKGTVTRYGHGPKMLDSTWDEPVNINKSLCADADTEAEAKSELETIISGQCNDEKINQCTYTKTGDVKASREKKLLFKMVEYFMKAKMRF